MVLAAGPPALAAAQAVSFGANDVADLIAGGIAEDAIAIRAFSKCVTFKMTPAVTERFRSLGATSSLLSSLGKACYKGPDDGGKKPKVVPAIVPKPVPPVRPATKLTEQYFRYRLTTRSGIPLSAARLERPPPKGRYFKVESDALGRTIRVVGIRDGNSTSETLYAYTGSSRIPDSLTRYLPTGELASTTRPSFSADGIITATRTFDPTGALTASASYLNSGDHRERIDSLAPGRPRDIEYFSPEGILIANTSYFGNGGIRTEQEFDPSTGYARVSKTFRRDSLSVVVKQTREADGSLIREDIYDSHDVWLGVIEYVDGLEVVTRYKWSDGQTEESRPKYDARLLATERTFQRNGTNVGKFIYDRYPSGRIKRTLFVDNSGQLMAEYPDVIVSDVERDGHASDRPTIGTIYKTTPWW